jgi:tRNA G18 (ribose-2'-O)-methylase SpoU
MRPTEPQRTQIAGWERVESALASGQPLQLLLVHRDDDSQRTTALIAAAQARGATVWRGSTGDLTRMSRSDDPEPVIAMLGPSPEVDLDGLLQRGGAVWLLHRAAYPSNVGFAIRTAEVSGAQGIVVDAGFNHDQRSRAAHVSMGAHRVLPILWETTSRVLELAPRYGHRLVALEDSGASAPWEIDLTGPVVFIAGNEKDGLAPELLARCDSTIALPMAGFVPSYNLHAAIVALAAERLRQLRSGT